MVLVVLPVLASAQNYVVDNIFGKDSVAFTTGVKKERASAGFGAGRKKGGTAEVAIDTIYVRNGEAVRLKEVKKDSLRLFGLLLEEVPVLYGKKTCYTLASNLKLSADNPEGTVDPLVARLKNHRNLDIHGRDRWLFSRWLVLALLILGLVGVLASLFVGKTGRILLMSAVLLLDAYIFRVGLDTALWFLEPALTREWLDRAVAGVAFQEERIPVHRVCRPSYPGRDSGVGPFLPDCFRRVHETPVHLLVGGRPYAGPHLPCLSSPYDGVRAAELGEDPGGGEGEEQAQAGGMESSGRKEERKTPFRKISK